MSRLRELWSRDGVRRDLLLIWVLALALGIAMYIFIAGTTGNVDPSNIGTLAMVASSLGFVASALTQPGNTWTVPKLGLAGLGLTMVLGSAVVLFYINELRDLTF